MATLTGSHHFVAQHTGPDTPDDPNLFSADEIAAYTTSSTAASAAGSILVSQVASGGSGSIPVSTADSKAVSAAANASTANSSVLSASSNVSVADSKALSNSVVISAVDSKVTSVATAFPGSGNNPTIFGLDITGAAGTVNRQIALQTSGVDRWKWRANSNPESGSNAGSDFVIDAMADDGDTRVAQPVFIKRSTGEISLEKRFFPAQDTGAFQFSHGIFAGVGAPDNANGSNGDFYFRGDTPGVANQRVYVKSAGAWVGIV